MEGADLPVCSAIEGRAWMVVLVPCSGIFLCIKKKPYPSIFDIMPAKVIFYNIIVFLSILSGNKCVKFNH